MYKRKRHFEEFLLCLLDLLSIVICIIAAGFIRYRTKSAFLYMENVQSMLLILAVMHFAIFYTTGIFSGLNNRSYFQEFFRICVYNVLLVGSALLFGFGLKEVVFVSRLVSGYFLVLNTIFMSIIHYALKKISTSFFPVGSVRNVIIMADESDLPNIADRFINSKEARWNIVAACPTNSGANADCLKEYNIPLLSLEGDELYEFSTQAVLDEVFIQVNDLEGYGGFLNEQIQFFEQMGVVVNISLALIGIDTDGINRVYTLEDYPVLAISSRLFDYRMVILKRLMDIAGSIVGLIITAIVSIILIPLIKLDSPGPIFFRQDRIGMNGRVFKLYKFRSMYEDAEERKKELMDQNEMTGLMFKMENDPRITKVGRFIRKTSLDELPQFWNVLKGDMSLVGTRPPTVDEYMQYNAYQKRRISFKPGITGLWQVSGRNDIKDFDEIVKLDLAYIDNWSIWLDIKIIFKTILVVLGRKGAQ